MPAFRVVLYAEGPGETIGLRRSSRLQSPIPPPGDPLPEESLGPGHVLIRRCLEAVRHLPAAAIRFDSPQRIRARIAGGSDLLIKQTLRELLTWLHPNQRPDLAVVFVDRDGEARRRATLSQYLDGLPATAATVVLGVAREEFEAWLVADEQAVASSLHCRLSKSKSPERMAPREAKELLTGWLTQHQPERDAHPELRRQIAECCSLDVVRKRCPAFESFIKDLGRSNAESQ